MNLRVDNDLLRVGRTSARSVCGVPAFVLAALTVICPAVSLGQLSRAKVTHEFQIGHASSKPEVIYVTDFAVDPSQLESSSPLQGGGPLRQRLRSLRGNDASPEGKAQAMVDLMANSIVRNLQAKKLNAQRASTGIAPKKGWIIKGRYTTLEQGSRAASSQIGFGVGSPVVQVEVTLDEVQNGKQTPILLLGTNKENPKTPGGVAMAAATHNPYAMAIKFVRSRKDLQRSVQQTAKLIAGQVAKRAGV